MESLAEWGHCVGGVSFRHLRDSVWGPKMAFGYLSGASDCEVLGLRKRFRTTVSTSV